MSLRLCTIVATPSWSWVRVSIPGCKEEVEILQSVGETADKKEIEKLQSMTEQRC